MKAARGYERENRQVCGEEEKLVGKKNKSVKTSVKLWLKSRQASDALALKVWVNTHVRTLWYISLSIFFFFFTLFMRSAKQSIHVVPHWRELQVKPNTLNGLNEWVSFKGSNDNCPKGFFISCVPLNSKEDLISPTLTSICVEKSLLCHLSFNLSQLYWLCTLLFRQSSIYRHHVTAARYVRDTLFMLLLSVGKQLTLKQHQNISSVIL